MTSNVMKLSDVCEFSESRVTTSFLDFDTYISTENMRPNKEGIAPAKRLPTAKQVKAYKKNDVLLSNIRPYFKKIWFADRDGGCSNDVLVVRAKENNDPKFLYYLLSDDTFFDYATATARGTKMPRGDKSAIMQYEIPDVPMNEQIMIAEMLSVLDAKIEQNKVINNHLAPKSVTDNSPDIRRGSKESRAA